MKTIHIKKTYVFIIIAVAIIAYQYYERRVKNQTTVINTYVIHTINCPVSVINIENKQLTPEQVKISPRIMNEDSIQIYHLYSKYQIAPTLSLRNDTLLVLPINMSRVKGISLKDFGDLHLSPNKNQKKIILNGKEIWTSPEISQIKQ